MYGNKKILSLVLPLALLGSQLAQAELSLSAVGILNFSNSAVSPAPPSTSKSMGTTVGFGVLGAMPIFPGFSAEIGALYVPRKVGTNIAGVNVSTLTSNSLEVPLLVRCTLLPIVSFGLGVYYAHTLGDGTTSRPNVADTPFKYELSNVSTSDFGLEASVAASYPILPMLSIVGDVRYLLGLTNQTSGTTTTQYRDLQFLAGVSVGL